MSTSDIMVLDKANVILRNRRLFKKTSIKHILHDISFTVQKGEALGVIGFNGAGKSTLLRLLAGILIPDSGTLVTYDNATTALLSLAGGIFPECSGRENAIILLMLQQNLTAKEAATLIPSIADFAELNHAIDAPMRTYSSGMLSRLKFAIAIQANPDILLVDEVLAVGDAAFAVKSMNAMREKIISDTTVVLVSHSLFDVYSFCTRAIWLDEGKIVAQGDAKEVVMRYRQHCLDRGVTVANPERWYEFTKQQFGESYFENAKGKIND